MSETAMRDLVARLATEPALSDRLDADPDTFAREHDLSGDEIATLRSLTRGGAGGGPVKLRERLSRSGMTFGGALSDLAESSPTPTTDGNGESDKPSRGGSSDKPSGGGAVEKPARGGGSGSPADTGGGTPSRSGFDVPSNAGAGDDEPIPGGSVDAEADDGESLLGGQRVVEPATGGRPTPNGPPVSPPIDGEAPNGQVDKNVDGESEDDFSSDISSSLVADRRQPPGTPLVVPENPPNPTANGQRDDPGRREFFDLGPEVGELYRYDPGTDPWGDVSLHRPDGVTVYWRNGSVSRVFLPDGSSSGEYDDGSGRRFGSLREPDGYRRDVTIPVGGGPPDVHYFDRQDRLVPADQRDQRTGLLADLPEIPREEPIETYVDRQSQSVSRVYANGTTVTSYQSGIVFTELSDGSTVESRPDGGSTTRRPNADGSWHFIDREPGPPPAVIETTRWLDPFGAEAAPPAGLASLPPQPTGVPDSVTRGPDGSIVRSYPDVTVTSRPDGSVVADYGPAGTVERRADNGLVIHTRAAGDVLVVSPDRSSQHATPRADGTFTVVPTTSDGRSGEPFVGRPDGSGGYTLVDTDTGSGGRGGTGGNGFRGSGGGSAGGGRGTGGSGNIGGSGGGAIPSGAGGGSAPDPGLPIPPPDASVEELPGGGQLIRYADGSTATVLPNGDGSFHVVNRDASGAIVSEYDTGGVPDPAPADDEPVSLLGLGAAAVGAGAVAGGLAAAAARRRRTGGPEDGEV